MSDSDTSSVRDRQVRGMRRSKPRWRGRACVIGAALLGLAGCGGGIGDISGEVTFAGKPLTVGRVNFLSEVGKQEVVSAYVVRGKYRIAACPAGPVRISVESVEPPDPEALKGTAARMAKIPGGAAAAKGMKEHLKIPPEMMELASGPKLTHMKIPLKYANPNSSGLTYEVRRGEQIHDIPLLPE